MKSFHIFAIICSLVLSNLCCAEQEKAELSVTPIKELKIEGMDFENLPKESRIGNLSEFVQKEEGLADILSERVRKRVLLYPYSEGLAYVNGWLCHIGNYPQSIIYTVLEGPHYGTQTTTTHDGVVLYVNYDYVLEYIPGGVALHHYYSDSKVVTGSTQVIKLY